MNKSNIQTNKKQTKNVSLYATISVMVAFALIASPFYYVNKGYSQTTDDFKCADWDIDCKDLIILKQSDKSIDVKQAALNIESSSKSDGYSLDSKLSSGSTNCDDPTYCDPPRDVLIDFCKEHPDHEKCWGPETIPN
ncbi:MAG: hypothetical protein AB7U98_12170 [Candidatus Nitrosocosmicus sp.]